MGPFAAVSHLSRNDRHADRRTLDVCAIRAIADVNLRRPEREVEDRHHRDDVGDCRCAEAPSERRDVSYPRLEWHAYAGVMIPDRRPSKHNRRAKSMLHARKQPLGNHRLTFPAHPRHDLLVVTCAEIKSRR